MNQRKRDECDHIIGFDILPHDVWVELRRVSHKRWMGSPEPDIPFNFCPECGEKL